jgi:hypothetical protein
MRLYAWCEDDRVMTITEDGGRSKPAAFLTREEGVKWRNVFAAVAGMEGRTFELREFEVTGPALDTVTPPASR